MATNLVGVPASPRLETVCESIVHIIEWSVFWKIPMKNVSNNGCSRWVKQMVPRSSKDLMRVEEIFFFTRNSTTNDWIQLTQGKNERLKQLLWLKETELL